LDEGEGGPLAFVLAQVVVFVEPLIQRDQAGVAGVEAAGVGGARGAQVEGREVQVFVVVDGTLDPLGSPKHFAQAVERGRGRLVLLLTHYAGSFSRLPAVFGSIHWTHFNGKSQKQP